MRGWLAKFESRFVASTSALAVQFFRGASSSFLVKVAGAGLGFGLHVILAQLLGVSEYGIYLYTWTWVTLLALPCTLGFKGALVRFVSEYKATAQWARLRGVLWRSLQIVFGMSLIVGLIAAGGVYLLPPEWRMGRQAIAIGIIALPFVSVNLLRKSALQGLKQVALADMAYLLLRPASIVVLVAAVYFWQGHLLAEQALLLTVLALLASFVLATYWTYKHLPTEARTIEPVFEVRKWLKTAFPFLLISGAALVQSRTDILMLGMLAGAEQVGVYGAAVRLTTVITFGLSASNMIVAPMISELYRAGDTDALQRVISIAAGWVFLYTLAAGIGLLLAGQLMLKLFGPMFIAGFPALVVLIAKSVVVALAGPVGYLATMTGHQWAASKAFGAGAALNILMNAVLIPRFGIVGAASATAISAASWNLMLAYYAWAKLGIDSTILNTVTIAASKMRR